MQSDQLLSLMLDPSHVLTASGLTPDPWQSQFLRSTDRHTLINVCRQGGKSRAVSALAIHTALFRPHSTTIILSPVQRQSTECFHKILQAYNALKRPVAATYETQLKLELANGARVICLPGKEETVRGYSPDLILIDEAARVPDDLYHAVRPMLAVTNGRIVALSTPFGQRGWFYREWISPTPWTRIQVTAADHPRIDPSFLAQELDSMGQSWIDQEYNCLFTAMHGLVYPDIISCCKLFDPSKLTHRRVGGIDWGWRNPFAAVWGTLDRDDILWLHGERYLRTTPLRDHAAALNKNIEWYADPAGRSELEEFRIAGLVVRRGKNEIRPGIAAVNARIRSKALVIHPTLCRNLIAEAQLYRYPTPDERQIFGENPIDADNHALGALRYLISRIDARLFTRLAQHAAADLDPAAPNIPTPQVIQQPRPSIRQWFAAQAEDEFTWNSLN